MTKYGLTVSFSNFSQPRFSASDKIRSVAADNIDPGSGLMFSIPLLLFSALGNSEKMRGNRKKIISVSGHEVMKILTFQFLFCPDTPNS